MKVLVTHASKHGSTSAIAREIGAVMTTAGHEVTVLPVERVHELPSFDAVVAGSGIYYGHWMPQASKFIRDNREVLLARPVWLFSSGPLGDPPKPPPDSIAVDDLVGLAHAREHVVFAGALKREGLNLGEKLVMSAVHAAEGDFREWQKVRAWAASIAAALRDNEVVTSQRQTVS